MYLIILFALLTFTSWLLVYYISSKMFDADFDFLLTMASIFISIIFVGSLIVLPINRSYSSNKIVEYQSRQKTIQTQRENKNISELELATLSREIISDNAWLETTKAWTNSKWVGIYYDKEINNLSPIK